MSRLWLRVFFAGFAVVLAMLLVTWFTPVFHGDLARIGRLSERAFGWRAPQPAVDAALLQSVRFHEADVLVVGDSFSVPLLWQSVLVRDGLRVKTIEWRHIPGLCRDFAAWARAQGFRGAVIVAQSVERELDALLARSAGCSMQGWALADVSRRTEPPPTAPPGFELNWREALTTGVVTAWHTWRAERAEGVQVFGDAALLPVPRGCELFSHRLCEKTLVLAKDLGDAGLDAADADVMAALREAQRPLDLLWIVVPDKASVYADEHSSFWAQLVPRSLGPDLHAAFEAEKWRVRDLYAPDDTHLSTAGYLRLGEIVRAAMP